MIQLPENNTHRKRNNTLKYCQEPGCGKEYYGHPITKYCEFHRNLSNRVRKRYIAVKVSKDNFVLDHSFRDTTIIRRNCACCGAEYDIIVIPRQKVYSKYCEIHTNNYRRELYASKN